MKLGTYENDNSISLNDKVSGTDAEDANKTKNYTFQKIKDFLIAQGLGGGGSVDISGKVDKVTGKSLILDTEIARLGTITAVPVKTSGNVDADNVSAYQILSYDLNIVSTSGASDKVVLPTTTVIGKEVLVFALNNANPFTVRGNQSGTAVLSPNGISSYSTNVSISPNISYRFIHLGSGYWKAEVI